MLPVARVRVMTTSAATGRWLIASMGASGRRATAVPHKPEPHDFRDDTTGTDTCTCRLPHRNARHTMPEPPAEARVIDARVLGEHEHETE